jgi:hypothetical protein
MRRDILLLMVLIYIYIYYYKKVIQHFVGAGAGAALLVVFLWAYITRVELLISIHSTMRRKLRRLVHVQIQRGYKKSIIVSYVYVTI